MKQHGPWKIQKRAVKYKNQWMEVVEDQVIQPDGRQGVYGTVRMRDGIAVLAMDGDENVYLTKEFHYAFGDESLEVVSGGIDNEETPLEAAKRELKEESGIGARQWVDLGKNDPFTSAVKSSAYLFLARDLTFGKAHADGTEVIDIVKIPFLQAVEMVMENKITHGTSCVLILKTKLYLESLNSNRRI